MHFPPFHLPLSIIFFGGARHMFYLFVTIELNEMAWIGSVLARFGFNFLLKLHCFKSRCFSLNAWNFWGYVHRTTLINIVHLKKNYKIYIFLAKSARSQPACHLRHYSNLQETRTERYVLYQSNLHPTSTHNVLPIRKLLPR